MYRILYEKTTHVVSFLLVGFLLANAAHQPEFSTAGFYELAGTGRSVYNMNPAWRLYKGGQVGAERPDFDDSSWTLVSLPNGIEYLPTEASGCVNYQGEVWYRKHFKPEESWQGKSSSCISRPLWESQRFGSTINSWLPILAGICPL